MVRRLGRGYIHTHTGGNFFQECNKFVCSSVALFCAALPVCHISLADSSVEFMCDAFKIHGNLCHLFIGEDTSCRESVLLP